VVSQGPWAEVYRDLTSSEFVLEVLGKFSHAIAAQSGSYRPWMLCESATLCLWVAVGTNFSALPCLYFLVGAEYADAWP